MSAFAARRTELMILLGTLLLCISGLAASAAETVVPDNAHATGTRSG